MLLQWAGSMQLSANFLSCLEGWKLEVLDTTCVEEACQRQEGSVDEGQTASWNTVHFNTYEAHELTVLYEEGQDHVNIHQTVFLQYEALETLPNV